MSGERVLVVDDEPAVTRLCQRTLEGTGYQVQATTSGVQALAYLEEQPFELLVIDLKMPGVDGLVVLRRAKELHPDLTPIVITGYGTLQNAIESLRAGARGFILKPFKPDDLLEAIQEALQECQREQDSLRLRALLPILEVGQALVKEGDVRSLARCLLEVLARQAQADRSVLLLADDKTGDLYVAGARGIPAEVQDRVRVPAGSASAGRMLSRQEPEILSETVDPGPPWRELLAWPEATTVLVPLRVRQKPLGMLAFSRLDRRSRFTLSQVNLLATLADQAALAIENARLFEQAQEQLAERKRTEEYMLHTERLRAMGRLATALAHEISNPLQAIATSIELVLDFPLGEEERQAYLQAVRKEIERLMTLTSRILHFARPPTVERQPIPVSEVVNYTLGLADKQLQRSGIRVSIDLGHELPPVLASRDHLAQVFLNLVINAVEFMPRGGELSISARCTGPSVEIVFADTGPGISAEALPMIFEPFYTTKEDGTGLGLSISHSIIRQHNGTITARNGPHGGAIFTITLPLVGGSESRMEEVIA